MKLTRTHRLIVVAAALAIAAYVVGLEVLFAAPVLFGALTLEDAHLTFQRVYPDARSVPVAEAIRCFKKVHAEHLKNVTLQFVPITGLDAADVVIADAACKLYFVALKKPAGTSIAAWVKFSQHATVAAAAGDLVLPFGATDTNWHTIFNPEGLPIATGLTARAHTTVNGNTGSAAGDAPVGFAIIGAA